jgi:hypothetical protein
MARQNSGNVEKGGIIKLITEIYKNDSMLPFLIGNIEMITKKWNNLEIRFNNEK